MDVAVDINQNHDNFFSKNLVHPNTSPAFIPHLTNSEPPTESPSVSKLKLLFDELQDKVHDDVVFDDDIDENNDDEGNDDQNSCSDSSNGGFVKRRIERWEQLSQGDETDVTGAVIQGQASFELRQRDLPAPVVIPPTFLQGSVSTLREHHSEAENELSFIRFNVIQMKADFQMTELKLNHAKWQYDVNKGNKRPVRTQKRNPALSWSSDNLSLPDIPENMAVRKRGEGAPNVAQQISLASFGNDGRRRDKLGHHHLINQAVLSSSGGQNTRSTLSQSRLATPPYGSQGQTSSPAKVNQDTVATQRRPANNHGLEAMELQLRNMNKPIEQKQPAPQRTLIAALQPFGNNRQHSQRMSGSGGIESHDYQRNHRQTFDRSGTSNIQTSQVVQSPRTIPQRDIVARTNVDLVHSGIQLHDHQRDHRHNSVRSGTSNIPTYHAAPDPSRRTIPQGVMVPRTNKDFVHSGIQSHDYQRGQQPRIERSGPSNLQTSPTLPSPRTIMQDNMVTRTNKDFVHARIQSHDHQRGQQPRIERSGPPNLQTSHTLPSPRTIMQDNMVPRTNKDFVHAGIQSHDYQRGQQHAIERSGPPNLQTSHTLPNPRTIMQDNMVTRTNEGLVQSEIQTRDYQSTVRHWFERSGPSNLQTSHSLPDTRTISQDGIITRPNDKANLKIERDMLLNDLSDFLVERDIVQQLEDEMEDEMSSGGLSEGFGYDSEDSWEMGTSESHVETNDVGTQFPYSSGESLFEEQSEFETEYRQDESKCLIEGTSQTFQSSEFTYDVCIQVSVRPTTETTPNGFAGVILAQDNSTKEAELSVDNSELQEQKPSMTPLREAGETRDRQDLMSEGVEDLVLPLSHPNDNEQFSDVSAHLGNVLDELAQEMDTCNTPINMEQEQVPETPSQWDETLMNNKNNTSNVVVEEFVPSLKCSHDNAQLNATGAHRDNVLEKLSNEMDSCNTLVSVEQNQRERTPETSSHLDETLISSQSDTSKVVVEEFVPRLERSSDNAQFSAGGAHRDDDLEKLALEMENGNPPSNLEHQDQALETFSQGDETLPKNQSDTIKVVVEEFVPRLKCSHDNAQFGTGNGHSDDMLEKLAQEMDTFNTPVSVEELEQVPENFSHMDETSMNNQGDTSKVVVEEFVPRLKCSHDNVEFSSGGAHHDNLLGKLTEEMGNGNVNVEQQEKPQESFSHVDETLPNSQSDTSTVVVAELVSHDNVQFSAVATDYTDVLGRLADETDNRTIPVKTDSLHVEEDLYNPSHTSQLHVSVVIKSDHREPEEQSPDKPTCLDQGPMDSHGDTNNTVVEEHQLHPDVSGTNVLPISVGAHLDDGSDILTLDMNICNNTANDDRDGLDATDDLHAKAQPSVSEGEISEQLEYDQQDVVTETPLDQLSMHIQSDTNKGDVEEMIHRLEVPGNKAQFKTNDAQRDKALEELTKEMDKSSIDPLVSHEQEMYPPSSDRCNVYDDESLVSDNFCELIAEDTKSSVNLLNLSSSTDEGNYQAKLSVGSPNDDDPNFSFSDAKVRENSDHRSQSRVENGDELNENNAKMSIDLGDLTSPNSANTTDQCPKPQLECDSPSLLTHVEDNNDFTKNKYCLSGGRCDVSANPTHEEDKPKTAHHKSDDLSGSFDDNMEFHTSFETKLAIDELAKDVPAVVEEDDATSQKNHKDTISKDSGVKGPVSPRRSKIPIPKSKLARSSSCPTRNRSNGTVLNQNSQTPKDLKCEKDSSLKFESISDKPLNVTDNTPSPTFSKSFSFRHERSRSSFKGGKQQRSHIPVPKSQFHRRGSCPVRSRPAIKDLNGKSATYISKDITNLTSHVPESERHTGKTRSRDIDITEALAVGDEESAGTTDVVTSDEQSTCEIESRISDASESLIPRDEESKPIAENDVQPLSKTPFDVDDFIQQAKQILSRIPIPQTNALETQSMPLHLTAPVGGDSQESKDPTGITEEVPEEDSRAVPFPERDMELLSLFLEVREDDTGSETLTLHSENDSDIQTPTYDDVLSIKSSETAEDMSAADGQRSSKSRIPVLKGSRRSNYSSTLERRDSEDETVDLSSRERSVARISPMPREVEDELTLTPSARKSFRSKIPLPSPIVIKQSLTINRSRSYSEADGGNAMVPEKAIEEVRREEVKDTEDEVFRDQHSESEHEYTGFPKRSQSSREVRPRGSYWAFSTSPGLASSEFERSQTLRLNPSKNYGRRSPAVTPITTPGGTPRTTPRGTPRITPRSSHRNTPRSTPRDTPKGGSLRRQYPRAKTSPTFKSRECAFVPLPEWNRLREVLSSGEQSKQRITCPSSPSEYSYTSRRSSEEFQRVQSPSWGAPVTTPKPSRWRTDGRVPQHLKKKYSSMNDMGDPKDLYQSDLDVCASSAAKEDTDSPWVKQSPIRVSSSSQSVSLTNRHHGVQARRANLPGERTPTNARVRSPYPVDAASDVQPMSSTEDVSTIWTEDDTLESSNFSLPTGAKKKSWKRRFSLRRKKSVDPSKLDPSKVERKESEQVKQEKKKRKNWLLRFLGIRK